MKIHFFTKRLIIGITLIAGNNYLFAGGYSTSQVSMTNVTTQYLSANDINKPILRISVTASSGAGSCGVDSIVFTLQNTNDADLSEAKLFYTSTTTTFNTNTLVSTPVTNPTGTIVFDNIGTTGVTNTTVYYWLVFNIIATPTGCNTVDAYIPTNGLRINGTGSGEKTPANSNPTGAVPISGTPCFFIGNGTSLNTLTGDNTPFGNYFEGRKEQYLITASDLNTAGVNSERIISRLAFNVANVGTCNGLNNFAIYMKNTSSTSLSTTWETGFLQVYDSLVYQPLASWNYFNFKNNFLWDGTSNVIIEVCFNDEGIDTYTQNPTTYYNATGATTTHYYRADNDVDLCINPGAGSTISNRPNISLKLFTDTSNFTCTIKGKVFNDINGNCIMDTSDSPLSNWKIKLEPGSIYYTTNLDGEYSIKVDTGTYIISQVSQPFWKQICPTSPANYTISFLLPNDSSINNNFTNQNKYNTIKGKVFNDFNGNCLFDSSDVLLINWQVKLDPGGVIALTDSNGNYSFKVDTGNFTISQITQALYQNICPISPNAYTISFTTFNDSSINNNFANQNKYNTIKGKVFNDFNGNCLFDSSDVPLINWQVKLDPGGVIALTDSNGNYSFAVDTGTFTISQIMQTLYQNICPLSPNTYTISFTTYNDSAINKNFANKNYGNTIKGNVFYDKNKNCVRDSGEIALSNWKIIIYHISPPYSSPAITYSDSDGNYSLLVDTGKYHVYQPLTIQWKQYCPNTYYYTVVFSNYEDTSYNNFSNYLKNLITGTIFHDNNINCVKDSGEVPMRWVGVQAKINSKKYTGYSDINGNYFIWVDTGTYIISPLLTRYFYQVCPVTPINYTVNFSTVGDTVSNINFGNGGGGSCPYMWVDVAHCGATFRPCFKSSTYVRYCNWGLVDAINAYIDIEFTESVIPIAISNTLILSPLGNNTYRVNLGTVLAGQCNFFVITDSIACDTQITGQTGCIRVHIYPDTLCTVDSVWDKSSIAVKSNCVSDSLACFTVYNTGVPQQGNMQGSSNYKIYQNNILVYTSTFQLAGGDSMIVCWPANGNTIRLEADQRPGHHGKSKPNDFVEACGGPPNVLGQVLGVMQYNADNIVDVACLQIVLSYDPNLKEVFPPGLTEAYHYTDSTDILEYVIRFQNTGTDTAFNIVIEDTLSPYLNTETIQLGASSHTNTLSIVDSNILQFTFDNILLPDSNVNEPESHGFVSFSIEQKDGNSIGNVIENKASIVFDINAPVITNTVFNTIGNIDSLTTIPCDSLFVSAAKINPTCSYTSNGSINAEVTGGTPAYYYNWNNGTTSQNINNLPAGNFILTVTDGIDCQEVITSDIIAPDSISINYDVDTASLGLNDGAINITVSGGNSPYTYLWSDSSTTEDIDGLSAGTYTIKIEDFNGCIDSAIIIVPEIIGIELLPPLSQLTIYPNPFEESVTITFSSYKTSYVSIDVFNSLGIIVSTLYNDYVVAYQPYSINTNMPQLSTGVYYCRIRVDELQTITKLTKLR